MSFLELDCKGTFFFRRCKFFSRFFAQKGPRTPPMCSETAVGVLIRQKYEGYEGQFYQNAIPNLKPRLFNPLISTALLVFVA